MPAERLSDLLRLPAGPVDLHAIDPRATPAFDGGKKAARATLPVLGERRLDAAGAALRRGPHGRARAACCSCCRAWTPPARAAPIRHVVGQVDPRRSHVTSFKAPDARRSSRTTSSGASRAQLPGAGRIGVFDRSHYEDVLAVRVHDLGRRAHVDAAATARSTLRGGARRERHARGQVLPAHLPRGAARAAARAPRRPDQALEVQPRRPRRPRAVGGLHGRLRGRAGALQHRGAPWHVVPADRKWYRNWAVTNLLIEQLEEMALRWPRPRPASTSPPSTHGCSRCRRPARPASGAGPGRRAARASGSRRAAARRARRAARRDRRGRRRGGRSRRARAGASGSAGRRPCRSSVAQTIVASGTAWASRPKPLRARSSRPLLRVPSGKIPMHVPRAQLLDRALHRAASPLPRWTGICPMPSSTRPIPGFHSEDFASARIWRTGSAATPIAIGSQ